MPSSLSSNAPLVSTKQSPLAAHLPSSLAAQRPATSPTSNVAAKPKAAAGVSVASSSTSQSASAKIAQRGVPLPQQLTVKPKVVPTMTAIRPLSQQQPRAPRSIAVEAKVPVVTKPSVVKPAVTKAAASVAAITSPSVLSSSSNSNNSGNTPVIVAVTTGGQTIYEEDDSDPNRLWCFCRMPHTPVRNTTPIIAYIAASLLSLVIRSYIIRPSIHVECTTALLESSSSILWRSHAYCTSNERFLRIASKMKVIFYVASLRRQRFIPTTQAAIWILITPYDGYGIGHIYDSM